jgi:hypothetical protein
VSPIAERFTPRDTDLVCFVGVYELGAARKPDGGTVAHIDNLKHIILVTDGYYKPHKAPSPPPRLVREIRGLLL